MANCYLTIITGSSAREIGCILTAFAAPWRQLKRKTLARYLPRRQNKVLHNILLKTKKAFDNPFIIVGGIALFGALLRLYHLGFKSLWLDEAVLYWIANSGNAQDIITQNALHNSAPPLFAFLLNLTLKMGDSEMVLRLLPWLGGIAAIPAIFFLARQFLEKAPAYIVSFIVAIATTQTQYSQQLREYSLVFLMTIIILTFSFRQFRNPSWNNSALMASVMVLGIFLQYGLALLIIALNFVYVIEWLSAKDSHKLLLLEWVTSQFIVLCAVVAVYFLSLRQQIVVGFGSSPTSGYLSGAYWSGSITSFFSLAISNTRDIFDFAYPGLVFLFIIVIGFIVTLQDRRNHTALMMFAFPIILTFFAASARLYPYQGSRQDIFLTPMIYVLFGFGINDLLKITQQQWVVLLLLLFTIMIGFKPTLNYLNSPGYENMRPVAATLSELFEEGDRIYVYYAAKPAFTYYYRNNMESQIYGLASRRNPKGYFQELDNLLLSNDRIWMVFSHCYADECEMIPRYISEKRQVESVVNDNGAWLYLIH